LRATWLAIGAVGLILSSSCAFADPEFGAPFTRNRQDDLPPGEPGSSKEVIVTPIIPEKSRYPEVENGKYKDLLSQWGTEIVGSPSALGGNTITSGPKTRGIGVALEYQPAAFQGHLGRVSFGPQLNDYPFVTGTQNAPMLIPVWSIGGIVRYQLVLVKHQIVVPMVGYSYEHVSYHLADVGDGALSLAGPIFGGYILLNEVDAVNGGDLYVTTGITRTYLVVEGKALTGSDENLSLSGTSFFFGLRLEF